MLIKNKRLYTPLGLICLILSISVGKLGTGVIPRTAFFEGMFLGLSLVFGVVGLIAGVTAHNYE